MTLNYLNEWIHNFFGLSPETQTKIFASLVVILLGFLIKKSIEKYLIRPIEDIHDRYRWNKTLTYFNGVVVLVIVGRIWFEGLQSLATFFGLLSAGAAIALKDPLVSLVGWLFIIIRKPFEEGDRIEIGNSKGDVIDIRLFQFSLMEIGNWVEAENSTGRVIHIPNGEVFTYSLANYTKGFQFIWHEIPVVVTFESDWKKAKKILEEIAEKNTVHLSKDAEKNLKEANQKFMIFYSILTPKTFTSVKDSGVCLTMRYLCNPRKRRVTEELIWEDVLTEFAKHNDIDFAYPTQRFYNNLTEGKGK